MNVDWNMATASQLVHDFSDGALLYNACGLVKIRCGCLLPGSGVLGWLVAWLIDQDKLDVDESVRYLIASGVRVIVAPCRRVTVEVSHHQAFLWLGINAVEV